MTKQFAVFILVAACPLWTASAQTEVSGAGAVSPATDAKEVVAQPVDAATRDQIGHHQRPAVAKEEAVASLLSGDAQLVFFGGALLRGATASGGLGLVGGIKGGVEVGGRIQLGATAVMSAVGMQVPTLPSFRNPRYWSFGYVGPEVGFQVLAFESFALWGRGMFGVGGITHNSKIDGDANSNRDLFFVLEPSAELTAQLLETVRFGVGLGYRKAYGVQVDGVVPNADGLIDAANGLNIDLNVSATF